jgi:hypothetical protein
VTSPNFKDQVSALASAVATKAADQGAGRLENLYNAVLPFLYWIDYLKHSRTTGICDVMLDGIRSAIIETSACLVLGLVRPAISSMRCQIDVLLSWMYFKDHPIEWDRVELTGEGYKLKTYVLDYLIENIPRFKPRFQVLLSEKTRSEDDPYRLLSAHIHGQSSMVLPSYGQLFTVVGSDGKCVEIIKLQSEISEYANDILLACYAHHWASLPEQVMAQIQARLNTAKMAKLVE